MSEWLGWIFFICWVVTFIAWRQAKKALDLLRHGPPAWVFQPAVCEVCGQPARGGYGPPSGPMHSYCDTHQAEVVARYPLWP